MIILNISDKDFSFEGVMISSHSTKEVDAEIGQRLLALYWHNPLELVDEKKSSKEEPKEDTTITEETIEDIESSVVPELPKEQEPEINNSFICKECAKEFDTQKGLDLHSKRVHK